MTCRHKHAYSIFFTILSLRAGGFSYAQNPVTSVTSMYQLKTIQTMGTTVMDVLREERGGEGEGQ